LNESIDITIERRDADGRVVDRVTRRVEANDEAALPLLLADAAEAGVQDELKRLRQTAADSADPPFPRLA